VNEATGVRTTGNRMIDPISNIHSRKLLRFQSFAGLYGIRLLRDRCVPEYRQRGHKQHNPYGVSLHTSPPKSQYFGSEAAIGSMPM
jgi:hypothetical protein